MEKCGQCFKRPRDVKPLDAFGKECTNPRSLVRTVIWLGDLEISLRSFLQKVCKQGASKSDNQTQEPKRIDPNCIGWWREWGWGSREGTRCIRINRSQIRISEVKIRGVLGVRP